MNQYYTDGHSVLSGSSLNRICVANDVPMATEICNKLNSHAALLEAAILACDTFEMGGSTTKAWLALKAAIAKAKAEQS